MSFQIKARRSLIVYLNNVRQAKQLRRFGIVDYISQRMKYAVIYMDEADIEQKRQLIERLGFVKSVEISHWPDVDSTVGGVNEEVEFAVDDTDLEDVIVDEEV
ncbi:YlbG family protein [Weissella diestrammenae]|uniref:YlbG family protein n=1 Tax=Weissella diestrammenae TaxID=1162633 RepID=A0A7G9T5E6_9LACO|nr:YlbG family protein [Weissella diestrammenae]MCM0583180.1 YlbG family protein [Weissella diestrammenae]QNN75321.1 YlbG family protein [Weissella diestrammenae]